MKHIGQFQSQVMNMTKRMLGLQMLKKQTLKADLRQSQTSSLQASKEKKDIECQLAQGIKEKAKLSGHQKNHTRLDMIQRVESRLAKRRLNYLRRSSQKLRLRFPGFAHLLLSLKRITEYVEASLMTSVTLGPGFIKRRVFRAILSQKFKSGCC